MRKKEIKKKLDEIWTGLDEVITHIENKEGCVPKEMDYIYDRVFDARDIIDHIHFEIGANHNDS